LIAFNVELASNDVNLARSIARRVRERDGGLPAVRSLGLMLSERAQVSMNLVDYRQTGLHEALEAVSRFATDAGVAVHRSEIVGLVPQVALGPDAHRALELPEEAAFYWIEDRLAQA
jgi:glutamate formiminotransferase